MRSTSCSRLGSSCAAWLPNLPRSCVLGNGTSDQTRKALSAFSTACWQWKTASSDAAGSAAKSIPAYRRSFDALRNHDAVSASRRESGCIQQLALALNGRRQRGSQVGGVVEVGARPNQQVHRRSEPPQRPIRRTGVRSEEHTSELQSLR